MAFLKGVVDELKEKDPGQPEFHQAVEEVFSSLDTLIESHPELVRAKSASG